MLRVLELVTQCNPGFQAVAAGMVFTRPDAAVSTAICLFEQWWGSVKKHHYTGGAESRHDLNCWGLVEATANFKCRTRQRRFGACCNTYWRLS